MAELAAMNGFPDEGIWTAVVDASSWLAAYCRDVR